MISANLVEPTVVSIRAFFDVANLDGYNVGPPLTITKLVLTYVTPITIVYGTQITSNYSILGVKLNQRT